MIDDDNGPVVQHFNIRAVNVTKLNQAVDCEIIISEADHAIESIKRQIRDGVGDALWLRDATKAIEDIDHKKRLTTAKLNAIKERAANAPAPDQLFKARFLKVAELMLPAETYQKLREAAAIA